MWKRQNSEGFQFVPIVYPFNRADALYIGEPGIPAQARYALEKRITQARIANLTDYSFLEDFGHLEHVVLEITGGLAEVLTKEPPKASNLTAYLYKLDRLLSISVTDINGLGNDKFQPIDASRFPDLEQISGESRYYTRVEQARSLRSLSLSEYPRSDDLSGLSSLQKLDTLSLSFAGIYTLKGIGALPLACLYLTRCRKLCDLSEIRQVKHTLSALRIQGCNGVKDFSALSELTHLELLEISGTGTIEDIHFIRDMPKLKTLILGVKVLDGDLTPCLSLEYAACRSYRHYNLSDKKLPKGAFTRGNESIKEWRRLE